jgi:hypothetical protein
MGFPVNDKSSEPQISESNALTSIRTAYTLAATNECDGSDFDKLTVKHFKETLADIALTVASRKLSLKE